MQRIITILVLVLACACIAVTIGLIVQYLTENGVMDAARLYESPFTIHQHQPAGARGLVPADLGDGDGAG